MFERERKRGRKKDMEREKDQDIHKDRGGKRNGVREIERETVTVRVRKRGRKRERGERKTEVFTQDKEGKRVPGTGDKSPLPPFQCNRLCTCSVRVGSATEIPFDCWLIHTRQRANEIRKNAISFELERAFHTPPPRRAWMQSYVPSFNHLRTPSLSGSSLPGPGWKRQREQRARERWRGGNLICDYCCAFSCERERERNRRGGRLARELRSARESEKELREKQKKCNRHREFVNPQYAAEPTLLQTRQ